MIKTIKIIYFLTLLVISNRLLTMQDLPIDLIKELDAKNIGSFFAEGFLKLKAAIQIAKEEVKNAPENENQDKDKGIFDGFIDGFINELLKKTKDAKQAIFKELKDLKEDMFNEIDKDIDRVANGLEKKIIIKITKAAGKGMSYISLGTVVPFFLISYLYQLAIHRFKTPHIVLETSLSSSWYETIKWIFGIRPQASEDLLNNMVFSPETLEHIKEILGFEKLHDQYEEGFGNILCFGPSGTGKTMFVKALAQALGLEYAIFSASTFFQENAEIKSIDEVFYNMTKGRKLLIFFDEVDSLLAKRNILSPDSKEYKLLTHFFNYTNKPSKNFLFVGATNRPEILDEATHRRFHYVIEMPLPNAECREKAFNLFKDTQFKDIKGIDINNILTDTLIQEMAQITIGCSYSDIQTIMDHVRLLVRLNDKKVSPAMILEVTNRVKNKAGKFVKQY